jgi:CheY-like chemotaxis protein
MTANNQNITKIFLAEDDADDRMFFEDALKQVNLPTELVVTRDGCELMNALEIAAAPPPARIVFLDLNMPKKNGFECLKQIRSNPKLKNIPVVIFSTTDSADAVNETYTAGANYFICKPRSFPLLIKAIETVLKPELWESPRTSKESFFLAIA